MAIKSWLRLISSCGDQKTHKVKPTDKLSAHAQLQSLEQLKLKYLEPYLSKQVGDDHVRHGVSPAADLKSNTTPRLVADLLKTTVLVSPTS